MTRKPARRGPGGDLTHDAWQQQVIDLAHAHGWQHLHVRRTIGRGKVWTTSTNRKGWPDLFLWQPRRGGFAGVECKVGDDKATPEQEAVLAELLASGARFAVVAYPDDFEALDALLRVPNGG